jgi:hypothetical protein
MAFLTMRSKPQLVAASGRRFGLFKRAPGLKTSEPLRPVAPSFFQILSIVAWRLRSPSEDTRRRSPRDDLFSKHEGGLRTQGGRVVLARRLGEELVEVLERFFEFVRGGYGRVAAARRVVNPL